MPGLRAQGGNVSLGSRDVTEHWQVEAVLLDMDGTLVDTERVYIASLNKVLTAFGYADVGEICNAMVGLPGPECQALLVSHFGKGLPIAEINKTFAVECASMLRDGLPLKPGAGELLDALNGASCPMAVVTSSSRRTAEQHLTLAGIRARFDTIVTRDDVVRSKPSPDLYLLGAARLGISPQACVAVEDSSVGIAAAHAAGTIALMVPDLLQPNADTRAQCAAVLPDLHAVLALLQQRAGLGQDTDKLAR